MNNKDFQLGMEKLASRCGKDRTTREWDALINLYFRSLNHIDGSIFSQIVDTIDVREFPSVIDIVVRQAEIEIGDKGDKTCIACKGSGFLKAFRRDKEKLRRMVFRCTYCKTSEKYTKVLPWADVYGLSGVNLEKGGDDDEISVKNEN